VVDRFDMILGAWIDWSIYNRTALSFFPVYLSNKRFDNIHSWYVSAISVITFCFVIMRDLM